MSTPLRVVLVGCGDISTTYLDNAPAFAADVTIVACTDLDRARAEATAGRYGLALTTLEGSLADPTIDLVLNLTPPRAHAPVTLQALLAGKHVYSEKPLATSADDARELLDVARARGLSLAGAPDTFLGPPYQAARRQLEAGAIGRPIGAFLGALYGRPEDWHPNPGFLYAPGGGPLLDMGPYFLHVLIELLGPVASVQALAQVGDPVRTIATGPAAGTHVTPTTPTFITALLALVSGVQATLHASFDVVGHGLPRFELHGTGGTLSLPDPDEFDGPLLRRSTRDGGWERLDVAPARPVDARGAGLADQARALREGRPPRTAGTLAFHALEVMTAVLASAETGQRVELS